MRKGKPYPHGVRGRSLPSGGRPTMEPRVLMAPRPATDKDRAMAAGRFPTVTAEALDALRVRVRQLVRRGEPNIEVAIRDTIRD